MSESQLAMSILDDIMTARAPEDEPPPEQPQDDAGEPQDAPPPEGEPGEPEEGEPAPEAQEEPGDEDYVEWGDGQRASLADLVEAFEAKASAKPVDTQALRSEIRAELEKETAVSRKQIDDARDHYLQRADFIVKLIAPGPKPDRAKFTDNTGYFDRDAYEDAKDRHERRTELFQSVNAEFRNAQAAANKKKEDEAKDKGLAEAKKLVAFWPELADAAKRGEIQQSMHKLLGKYDFTPEEVDGLTDHRYYKIVKDLLAYDGMKSAKGAEVVKKKAAPKLVKAAARAADAGSAGGKMPAATRAYLDARKKIASTGKLHTGEEALAFLGDDLGIGKKKSR